MAIAPTPPPRAEDLAHFPQLGGRKYHPDRWEFPAYLDNPGCRWLQSLKELYDHPLAFPASLSPQAGLLLHGLVRNCRPRVVLEVGMFCSISTHWIAGALLENGCRPGEDALIHCFDDFQPIVEGPWREATMPEGREQFVKERLDRAGLLDFIEFHPGDSSTEIMASHGRLHAGGGVDFAYIDGNHKVKGACADFVATEPVLNTGGHLVVHDTFPDQCGGHLGPRYILDHVCTDLTTDGRVRGSESPAARRAGEQVLGEGVYDRVDLYLAPLNYGLGVLRRLR